MAEPIIRLDGVTKTYKLGDETIHALDAVHFSVNRGEFVAVVGPSGSGKSTLSNIIGGLDRPDAGTVVVDGQDLSRVSDRTLSRYRNKYIGFVFQSFNLQPHLTALENVMLPLVFGKMKGRVRMEKAKEKLTQMGLESRMHHRPPQLSGGQRQRVAVARALANDPSLIIADEPTGNLDSQKGREILQILRDLNKAGTTLIIITHDPEIARQADRIVEIHDGKLSERK